jgi:type II secretory pathway pseudopilin PulG
MLVQTSANFANTYSLVQFEIDLEMVPWFVPGEMVVAGAESTMCLYQEVNDDSSAIPQRTLSICVLEDSGANIEELTGEVPYSLDDCVNGVVNEFTVAATEPEVCFDTTSLVFLPTTLPVRRRRQLQNTQNYLFMILNEIEDAFRGNSFFTSNSANSTLHPSLALLEPTAGTDEPDGNVTEAPSASVSPSFAPSVSIQPSLSSAPSEMPSVSVAPSVSASPSSLLLVGTSAPCSICGEGQIISLANLESLVTLPGSQISQSCFEAQTFCSTGNCDATTCEAFPNAASEACGCVAANLPCSFCGEGQEVTDTTAVVEIPQGVLPGLPAELPCLLGETLCASGACTPDICMATPTFVSQPCACAPVV